MKYEEIVKELENYFKPETCTEVFDKMGEQYRFADDIEKVYTACFASDMTFEKLKALGAHDCMVFTHHPVGQKPKLGEPSPRVSPWAVEFMKENRIDLFTYHIPLDRNSYYSPGNNLAREMGVKPYDEFFLQNEVLMGVICNTECSTVAEIVEKLSSAVGHEVKLYPYGESELIDGRIAIMAGGADNTKIYDELRSKGVNLFITGITNPCVDWIRDIHAAAKKAGVSILGGTHYSTEKFAPMRMVEFFEKFGLPSEFIPEGPVMTEL